MSFRWSPGSSVLNRSTEPHRLSTTEGYYGSLDLRCFGVKMVGQLKLAHSERFSAAIVAELKRVRLSKGVSQKTLAEAAGLSRAAVTHIEAGIRNPTLIVCHALARALGVRFSSLSRKAESEIDG